MFLFARYHCLGTILVCILTRIVAYQFDVDNIILYEDPGKFRSRGSYFGYSIALWNPVKITSDESWIFVGAPRANSSVYGDVREPGTVFKCKIGKPKLCEEWALNVNSDTKPTSGSWLGGVMSIENKSNPEILVCGPRWTDKKYYSHRNFYRIIPGMCYTTMASHSPYVFQNQIPQTKPFFGYPTYAIQQAGFSIHIVPGSSPLEFVFGSPGAYSWHGTAIRYRQSTEGFLIPAPFADSMDGIDYSGYAITSGRYFKAQNRIYVTGVPRGADLRGKVDLFTFPLLIHQTIIIHLRLKGNQIGEYFGSALASCDIDGDERDDLLIGAPQWTKDLDEGKVYIYRFDDKLNYRSNKEDNFKGTEPRGRFGSTITCLGDIDYDGYADVAIGAPYDGNGAVHIFYGSGTGLKHRQIINGPEGTKGFGIAVSEPRDIDNNGYADIAVGAYLSGHVALIRSKRVVAMTVHLSTNLPKNYLDREAKSFSVNICYTFKSAYLPPELNVIRTLKIDEVYKRASIEIDGSNSNTYEFRRTLKLKKKNDCDEFKIKVNKEANLDYLRPLTLSVSQRLDTYHKKNNTSLSDNFHTTDAVTKDMASVEDHLDILFKVECNNNICYSNLSIEMATDLKSRTSFAIGTPALELDVTVRNTGDNAFLAKALIDLPIFIGIKIPSNCRKNSKTNNPNITQIICDIGNPFTKTETKSFSLVLDMSKVPVDTANIEFNAMATTASNNSASAHYKDHLSIVAVVDADIGITGKTDAHWYSYIQTEKEEQLPDIMFQHTYEIKNNRRTPLAETVLSISFPTHWSVGDNKIEIVKLNKTIGELDGKNFDCQSLNEASNTSSSRCDATAVTEWLTIGENSSRSILQEEKEFMSIGGKVFSASLENRTLYINTTNPSIKWNTIDCIIGPFKTERSAARVVLTFNLVLSNFTDEVMRDEDTIFYATNGSTKITMPQNFTQTVNNKPDVIMIATSFIVSRRERHVATWIIALSIFIGILLLILVMFALFKFGFFKRNKKLELKALIEEEENMPPRVDLETIEDSE